MHIPHTDIPKTKDQRGKDCDNFQMLGVYRAEDFADAAEQCRESLIEWQQSFDAITIRPLSSDNYYITHGIFENDERLEPYDN